MKNLIIGLFTALLMSAGLVGVAQSAADAAGCNSYTGCPVKTRTVVGGSSKVLAGRRGTFCVSVTADASGNGRPHGTVTLTVANGGHGFRYTATKGYFGKQRCFTTPRLQSAGSYTARAHFEGKGVYRNSNGSKGFTVVKRHR